MGGSEESGELDEGSSLVPHMQSWEDQHMPWPPPTLGSAPTGPGPSPSSMSLGPCVFCCPRTLLAVSVARGPVSFPLVCVCSVPYLMRECCAVLMEGKKIILHICSLPRTPGPLCGVLRVVVLCVHLTQWKRR